MAVGGCLYRRTRSDAVGTWMRKRAAGVSSGKAEDTGISRWGKVGGWHSLSLGCAEIFYECGLEGGISWRGPVEIPIAAPSTRGGGRLSLGLLRFVGHSDE
jgi:hypothetical protein